MVTEKSVSQALSRILSIGFISVIAIVPIAIAGESSYLKPYGEPPNEDCTFPELELPEDFMVYNATAYTGRVIPHQIDQSDHQATQIDVVVNSPSQPVVLMLGAHEPTIWDVQRTEGTNIVGVVASGYYRQAVAGLPEETPILTSTFSNQGDCGYFYDGSGSVVSPEPLSRMLFGQATENQFSGYRMLSPITLGEPIEGNPKLLSSDNTPVESFFNKRRD